MPSLLVLNADAPTDERIRFVRYTPSKESLGKVLGDIRVSLGMKRSTIDDDIEVYLDDEGLIAPKAGYNQLNTLANPFLDDAFLIEQARLGGPLGPIGVLKRKGHGRRQLVQIFRDQDSRDQDSRDRDNDATPDESSSSSPGQYETLIQHALDLFDASQ